MACLDTVGNNSMVIGLKWWEAELYFPKSLTRTGWCFRHYFTKLSPLPKLAAEDRCAFFLEGSLERRLHLQETLSYKEKSLLPLFTSKANLYLQ